MKDPTGIEAAAFPKEVGFPAATPIRTGPDRRSKAIVALFLAASLGLAALNAWLLYRDYRPLPDLKTIENAVWPKRFDRAGRPLPLRDGEYPTADRTRLVSAERDLREILRRSPNDGDARVLLARVLEAKGDILGCARELRQVPDWWPKKMKALESEAIAWLKLDRARLAMDAWSKIVSPDPNHPPSLELFDRAAQGMLRIFAYEERWVEARALLWKYYQISPAEDHPTILVMRMRLESDRIAPEAAIDTLARYAAADRDDYDALRALATVEQAVGRSAEAMEHARACLKGRPDDPRSWIAALKAAFEQGDEAALTAWAKQAPTRSKTYRYDNRPREETPVLTEADDIFAAEIQYYRGLAFERTKAWRSAAEAYREAVRLRPYREEYHFKLAGVEQILGQADSARAHRERNLELRAARKKMRDAYADYLDASRESRDAGSATPKLIDAVRRLVESCRDLDYPRAAEAWRKLLPAHP